MNTNTIFESGITPELNEVLYHRERRTEFIAELLKRHPQASVISLKCNIPGPIKNNGQIRMLYQYGENSVLQIIREQGWPTLYQKSLDLRTGPEGFWVIPRESSEVKMQMISFEEKKLGRLFDADVLNEKAGLVQSCSRTDLGYEPRRCLICSQDAKICASRRLHPVSELQQQIITLLLQQEQELNGAHL